MDRFSLSSEQKAAWAEQFSTRPWGIDARIAKTLEGARDGKASSWRTRLSKFFKGDPAELRAILGDGGDRRLQHVAQALGTTPGALRALFDRITGAHSVDGLEQGRLPGFEDLGPFPILDVFFPPCQRETQFRLPKGPHGSGGGKVDVAEISEALLESEGPQMFAAVGDRGLGRTPLAKAVSAHLAASGRAVKRWTPGSVGAGEVVFVDDVDRLDPARRDRLNVEVAAAAATLICTTSESDPLEDLPGRRVVCALRPGDATWAVEFLNHAERVLRGVGHTRVDLEPLRTWLEDDPYAAAFATRADLLGFLARHVRDGQRVPLRHVELADVAVRRWADTLRRRQLGPEAAVLEAWGVDALGAAAEHASRHGSTGITMAELARLLVERADGVAGDSKGVWGELGAPGMLRVVEAWVDVGLLQRDRELVRPAQDAVFVSALGRRLARRLDDVDLLSHVLLEPRWHAALVSAAEELGDACPVLAAIDAQPVEVSVMAFGPRTRVLCADARAGDLAILDSSFRRCLRWWATWTADPRTTTITFGGPPRPRPPRPAEALIEGHAPLLAMAIASRRHRGSLSRVSPDDVAATDLGEAAREYVRVLRGHDPTADAIRDAVMLGAPFQSDLLLEPSSWERLPGGANAEDNALPGGITRDEYTPWWRVVAAPRLQIERDGDARIAGCVEGTSITSGMTQVGRGVDLWADALARRIEVDDERAFDAFAEAVAFTVRRGGPANHRGLERVWNKVRGGRRLLRLRGATAATIPRDPDDWRLLEEFLTWMLRETVDEAARMALWATWTESGVVAHVPWRSFLDAGLPVSVVLAWAIDTYPDDPMVPERVERVPTKPGGGGVVLQLHEGRQSPQAAIVEHLLEHGTAEALEQLASRPEWAAEAITRLDAVDPAAARGLRLRIAVGTPPFATELLLRNTPPRIGEVAAWRAIAESAHTHQDRLVRWALVSLAETDEADRWDWLLAAVQTLEQVALGRRRGRAAYRRSWMQAAERPDGDPTAAFDQLYAELAPVLEQTLAHLGDVLGLGRRQGLPGIDDVVRNVLASATLRPLLLGMAQSWWIVALETNGSQYVLDRLIEGHSDRPDASVVRLDALTNAGAFDRFVRPLVADPVLGEAATRVVAARVRPTRPDVLKEALELRWSTRPRPVDEATLDLIVAFVRSSPDTAVAWAEQELRHTASTERRRWWQRLVGAVPPGPARARAFGALMKIHRSRRGGSAS